MTSLFVYCEGIPTIRTLQNLVQKQIKNCFSYGVTGICQ